MKNIVLTALLLIAPLISFAKDYTGVELDIAARQKFPKSDLQWNNIKGNVVSISTRNMAFKKAYGEWVKSGIRENRTGNTEEIYGANGNLLVQIEWDTYTPSIVRIFHYDAKGRRDKTDNYTVRDVDRNWSWPLEITKHKKEVQNWGHDSNVSHTVYEYEGGRLKNIITRRENVTVWENTGGARDIFRYNEDGSFTMTRYDDYGDEDVSIAISSDGHKETRSSTGEVIIIERDENGNVISQAFGVNATGGSVTGLRYFGYNENGDLLVQSSSEKMVQDLKELPWLKSVSDDNALAFFEYEYDTHGNWVTRKSFVYRSYNKDPEMIKWEERTITYVDDIGMTGEEIIKNKLTDIEVREQLRNEHPYVTFDGNLGETVLTAILPKLPKVSFLELAKGEEGDVTLYVVVSGDGVVEKIDWDAEEEYYHTWDRAELIAKEALLAIKELSGSPKWIKGYDGDKFIVSLHYYPSGKVISNNVR